MTSFWRGDGVGRRDRARAVRRQCASATRSAMAAGVKISPSRLASSRHFLSSPLRRTASASDSRRLSVSISAFSSAMVRAAVAWSRISSSAASTSLSGASSRSSTSSASSAGTVAASDGRDLAAALEQLQLAQPALQPLAAAAQRLVDRLGRGGEAALQDREREADRARALVVLQRLGAVELLAHVVGDRLVELRLGVGELVGHGVGDALGEERRGVELEQVLLDHPAHQVRDVRRVDAVAEAALEAVAVEQRHEELEVLFLAVVRRRRHQQEVPRQRREELARAGSAWCT